MQVEIGLLVLDMMPIYMIIVLDIVLIIRWSINFPTTICLPTVCYFSREATSKTYAPGSTSHHLFAISTLLFVFLFYFCFCFQTYIIINPKNTMLRSIFYNSHLSLSIYLYFTHEGLTTSPCVGLRGFAICVHGFLT